MNKKSNSTAKKIKIALINCGMTQADIAKKLGLTRQSVYMALSRGCRSGKVADWIRDNLNIKKNKKAA